MSSNWLDTIDEGIRDFVKYLVDQGYETTDSGDGSKAATMECALPYPHVFGMVPKEEDIKVFAHDLLSRVKAYGYTDPIVEVNYSASDRLTVFAVMPEGYMGAGE